MAGPAGRGRRRRSCRGHAAAAVDRPADDGVHGRQPERRRAAVRTDRARLPQLPRRGHRPRGRPAALPRRRLRVGPTARPRAGPPVRRRGPLRLHHPPAGGEEPVPQPGAERRAQGGRGRPVHGAGPVARRPQDARALRQPRPVRADDLRRLRGQLVLLRHPAAAATRRPGRAARRAAPLPRTRPAGPRRRARLRRRGRPRLALPLARSQRAETGAAAHREAGLSARRGRRCRRPRLGSAALGRRLLDASPGDRRPDRRGGHRLTRRLPQLPVAATGTPGQPGPGRKVPRRDGAGAAADAGAGTTRRTVPSLRSSCGGTTRAWRGGRLSRHHRSQSASRLPVEIARGAPLDGVPNNASGSLHLDDAREILAAPDRRSGMSATDRWATGSLPTAHREPGQGRTTVGHVDAQPRQPADRRAPAAGDASRQAPGPPRGPMPPASWPVQQPLIRPTSGNLARSSPASWPWTPAEQYAGSPRDCMDNRSSGCSLPQQACDGMLPRRPGVAPGARGCGRAVRIFLSYRRGDVGGYAGRLADALHERMGSKSVFQDVLDIAPGQDYTAVVDRALENSDALLAVIGPGWLAASTPQGSPRLFAGDDYVRLEIARALDRDVRVVPVLVGGASLPAAAELPDVLQRLAQRQAVVLHDETWHQDVDGLMRSLRGEPAVPAKRRRGLVTLAVAVPLAALGAGAWWLWSPTDGGGSGQRPEPELASCTPPAGDGWTGIELSADPSGGEKVEGGSLFFTVKAASWRPHGTAWQVTLATTMEAAVPSGAYHGDWRYDSLVVAQRQFPATCFSPSPDFVDANTVGDALIGFDVTCEPVGYIELRLENDADRIDVTPPTLDTGQC